MGENKNTHNDNNNLLLPIIVSIAVTIIFNYLIGRL